MVGRLVGWLGVAPGPWIRETLRFRATHPRTHLHPRSRSWGWNPNHKCVFRTAFSRCQTFSACVVVGVCGFGPRARGVWWSVGIYLIIDLADTCRRFARWSDVNEGASRGFKIPANDHVTGTRARQIATIHNRRDMVQPNLGLRQGFVGAWGGRCLCALKI